MMTTKNDRVLIVGAGPVGLVAASALADAGIPVKVVEASYSLPKDLRASTFHPATLDMLERFGVTAQLIEQGLICPTWQFRDRTEGVIATFDMGVLADDTSHPYRLQCEQWKLTALLRDRLSTSDLVDIEYEAEAFDVRQNADGVTLSIRRPDNSQEELSGRYLVAADGGRSAIRKVLGVPFEGETIPEVFLSMSTHFPFDRHIENLAPIAYITDPSEWVVLLRTPSLWRVLLPTDASLSDAELRAPDAMQKRLQAICPSDAPYEIVHSTAYRVNERVAARYVFDRVFLAGDAAHLNNPLGGMGMNGGIHDAINLADKLKKVWNGAALDTMGRYERQRRKAALETVQAQTLRNRRIMSETDPAARKAYHDELRRTVADPKAHRAHLLRSSMIQSLRELESVA